MQFRVTGVSLQCDLDKAGGNNLDVIGRPVKKKHREVYTEPPPVKALLLRGSLQMCPWDALGSRTLKHESQPLLIQCPKK